MTPQRTITALLAAFIALAPLAAHADASGSITRGEASCVTNQANAVGECGDVIAVHINVPEGAAEPYGALYVAVLPLTHGSPTSYQGAYATPSGWSIGPTPEPYMVGALRPTTDLILRVPGGICATAAHYVAGPVTLGVYAGYGTTPLPDSTNASSATTAREQALLQQAQASGNAEALKIARSLVASDQGSSQTNAALAAQNMLKNKTVWRIATVSCN